jgi:hypothetical protein
MSTHFPPSIYTKAQSYCIDKESERYTSKTLHTYTVYFLQEMRGTKATNFLSKNYLALCWRTPGILAPFRASPQDILTRQHHTASHHPKIKQKHHADSLSLNNNKNKNKSTKNRAAKINPEKVFERERVTKRWARRY